MTSQQHERLFHAVVQNITSSLICAVSDHPVLYDQSHQQSYTPSCIWSLMTSDHILNCIWLKSSAISPCQWLVVLIYSNIQALPQISAERMHMYESWLSALTRTTSVLQHFHLWVSYNKIFRRQSPRPRQWSETPWQHRFIETGWQMIARIAVSNEVYGAALKICLWWFWLLVGFHDHRRLHGRSLHVFAFKVKYIMISLEIVYFLSVKSTFSRGSFWI